MYNLILKNGEEEDCEEGEIVDDDDFRHESRRLCRFFSRGHCTWGIDCRFLHPGVNDKGMLTWKKYGLLKHLTLFIFL